MLVYDQSRSGIRHQMSSQFPRASTSQGGYVLRPQRIPMGDVNHANKANYVHAKSPARKTLAPNYIKSSPAKIRNHTPVKSASAGGPPVKILAYGDSLTAGYHNNGRSFSPYAPSLEATLRKHAGLTDVRVMHKGNSGWTSDEMRRSLDVPNVGLKALLAQEGAKAMRSGHSQDSHPVSLVVIIAGTNDLGKTKASPEQIAESVLELHRIAHAHGIKTVSIDVPSNIACEQSMEYRMRRDAVNQYLRRTAENDKMRIHTNCPISFRRVGTPGGELWEQDGIHFSRAGYNTLGRKLAPIVHNALKAFNNA